MSGARRARHAGLALGLPLLLLAGACRVGSNPALNPVATSARGVTVEVEWPEPVPIPGSLVGEVLGLGSAGVYILERRTSGPTLALYPFGADVELAPTTTPPRRVGLSDPIPSAAPTGRPGRRRTGTRPGSLDELAQYARYPFGIDEALLERLLDTLGQDEVAVRSGL